MQWHELMFDVCELGVATYWGDALIVGHGSMAMQVVDKNSIIVVRQR